MKRIKTIALAVSSLLVSPNIAHATNATPEQTGMAMMRLHNSPFSEDARANSSLWVQLRQFFRMDEVNQSLVRRHETSFVNNRDYFNRTITRSTPYMYHIMSEVQKRGMPAEIALLPFIESAFVTRARSRVGASGLWQFMPATGRHYGLEQTPLYDGRHDVFAATNAALNYLQYLHGLFGDWSLALAAYNWGEGNMSRAIRRAQAAGLAPTYENLNLPAETRNYVPKLLAVRNLVNNPQAFGLMLPDIKHEPYFKEVSVNAPLDIMAAAHLANISESEFLALNPAFKTPVFIPKGNNRRMLLPIAAVKTFESNYRASDPKTLLSWDVFTADSRMSISDIALQTGSSVSDLKRLNGITGNHIDAGRTILVNKNTMQGISSVNAFARADFDPVPDTYVEQAPVLGANTNTQPTFAPVAAVTPRRQPAPTTIVAPPTPTPVMVTAPAAIVSSTPNVQAATSATPEPTPKPQPTPDVITTSPSIASAPIIVDTPPAVETTATTNPVETNESANTPAIVAHNNADFSPAQATPNDSNTNPDELLALAQAAQERLRAAEVVRASLAQAEAEEARVAAAEARRRQQQAAAEKAAAEKANSERAKPRTQTASRTTPNKKPDPNNHKVVVGDTVYSIAKQYGISAVDLISANQLKNNNIRPGQVLKIVRSKPNNQTASTRSQSAGSKPRETVPATYTVRRGDTLQSIAERYKLNASDLKRFNNGSNTIKEGQVLKLRAR